MPLRVFSAILKRTVMLRWLLSSALLFLMFFALGLTVKNTNVFSELNNNVLNWFISNHNDALTIFWIAFTTTSEAPYIYLLVGSFLIWFAWHKQWKFIFVLVVALWGTFKLSPIFKHLFEVTRPIADSISLGYAYPSGHTFLATTGLGLLSLFVTQNQKSNQRFFTFLLINLFVLLVGMSRMYLGVHWLTDVLGGLLMGWSVNCLAFGVYLGMKTPPAPTPNRFFWMLILMAIAINGWIFTTQIDTQRAFYKTVEARLK